MGRFQSADNPDDPAGTSDETAAAKDENGQPISNGARNIWITETALATALNVSYMAEKISIFGLVVGVALIPDSETFPAEDVKLGSRATTRSCRSRGLPADRGARARKGGAE